MRDPVEVVLRGIAHTRALEGYIVQQAEKLDRACGRILACHVVAEGIRRPKRERAQFAVQLNITLPGAEVVVNREHGEDVYIALGDAFDAARLQLEDHGRRQSSSRRRSRNGTPDARG